MPQFTYRARNAQGGLVEGVLDCADRAIAIRQIESQHCIPIRIDMVEAAKPVEAKASAPHRSSTKIAATGLARSRHACEKPENSTRPTAHFH